MKNEKRITQVSEQDWEFEDTEPSGEEYPDRTLILRKQPVPRKGQLMHCGVKEVRCACCMQIRPIAGAEELGEGWICEECLADALEEQRFAGQRGR